MTLWNIQLCQIWFYFRYLSRRMDGWRSTSNASQHLVNGGAGNKIALVSCRWRHICIRFAKCWSIYHSNALSTFMSRFYRIAQHHQDHIPQSIRMIVESSEAKKKSQWCLELALQVKNLSRRLSRRVLIHMLWEIFQISVRCKNYLWSSSWHWGEWNSTKSFFFAVPCVLMTQILKKLLRILLKLIILMLLTTIMLMMLALSNQYLNTII